MESFDLLSEHQWEPFKRMGFDHCLLRIDATAIVNTWIIIAIVTLFGLCYTYIIQHKKTTLFHLCITFIKAFQEITVQTLGYFSFKHFSFMTSLFLFIFLCNSIFLIPGAEEPTKNINTTLALGLIAFLYVQYYALVTHGFLAYIKEYFEPICIMFPLNVVGKLASIISMSFRLFGNIFGGATISSIYFSVISNAGIFQAIFIPINPIILLFFGIFEGTIQAFVFAMLTITYISIATSSEYQNES